MLSPITVIGGAGRTGRVVASLLRDRGSDVRVLTRDPRRARSVLADDIAVYAGDVRDPATLDEPLRALSGVVISVEPGTANSGPDRPETTMYQGVLNVLDACRRASVAPYVVLVSQIYVTRKNHPTNQYGHLLDWRLRGEDAIRESGFPYTVVRPSWLTNEPAGHQGIRLEQTDTGDGSVSRADIGEICVQAMICPSANGLTFEVYNEHGSPPGDWDKQFAVLRKDR